MYPAAFFDGCCRAADAETRRNGGKAALPMKLADGASDAAAEPADDGAVGTASGAGAAAAKAPTRSAKPRGRWRALGPGGGCRTCPGGSAAKLMADRRGQRPRAVALEAVRGRAPPPVAPA
mmetsp:Transcript_21179/g.72933  ORF Transcript_21179/g.72933 Transcript_21179/m.72933 type:complete len:121 (+) Transcript_21179:1479-1841(+)